MPTGFCRIFNDGQKTAREELKLMLTRVETDEERQIEEVIVQNNVIVRSNHDLWPANVPFWHSELNDERQVFQRHRRMAPKDKNIVRKKINIKSWNYHTCFISMSLL